LQHILCLMAYYLLSKIWN